MPDFTTNYLGLKLNSPLVPSASPLSRSVDNLKRMEEAGAGAVVLYSLFEEQINAESHFLDQFLTGRLEQLPRGAQLFSRRLRLSAEPGRLSRTHPARQGGREHPDHRQPERSRVPFIRSQQSATRRLDKVRPADAGGRSRCSGAEPVLRSHGPGLAR